MATETSTALRLERTYSASPAEVFQAWTNPQQLKRWFSPSDEMEVPVAEIDLREGGTYKIEMRGDESFVVSGTYREISDPERLVFTWAWATDPDNESLVTVELSERDGGTALVLTHEQLADPESRTRHEQGWNGCLDRLASVL